MLTGYICNILIKFKFLFIKHCYIIVIASFIYKTNFFWIMFDEYISGSELRSSTMATFDTIDIYIINY